jgi:predicted nucleic acid-binding Zn finger protein
MVSETFLRGKEKLFGLLRKSSELTADLEREIIDVYGSRGKRALETLKKGGVIKRGDRWFVRGREEEYEVVQARCSCYDYVLNVVTKRADVDTCYHGLAKVICELLDSYYVSE